MLCVFFVGRGSKSPSRRKTESPAKAQAPGHTLKPLQKKRTLPASILALAAGEEPSTQTKKAPSRKRPPKVKEEDDEEAPKPKKGSSATRSKKRPTDDDEEPEVPKRSKAPVKVEQNDSEDEDMKWLKSGDGKKGNADAKTAKTTSPEARKKANTSTSARGAKKPRKAKKKSWEDDDDEDTGSDLEDFIVVSGFLQTRRFQHHELTHSCFRAMKT